MSGTTSESDDGVLSKDQTDSSSFDEGSCGGSIGGGTVLKKGPWTSTEDAILVDYVKKHGEGNWNAVQKHSGLFRCGKSCRLRWANHLRPNLKKGAFTAEEEHKIIELHAKMGNKWARMAAHLPGRTDNEIKNYWNTRIKRRQRAGLPLYPPDVRLQAYSENQKAQNTNDFNGGDTHHVMQASNFDIPEVIFDHLKSNQGVLSYAPPLPDISLGSMLNHGLGSSQNYSFMSHTMHQHKRLRGSEILFPGFNSTVTNAFAPLDLFQNDTCGKTNQSFGSTFPYDPDPNGKNPSTFGMIPGSHAILNGNFSTSKPIPRSLKLELPSLQYPETDLGSWGMSSSQPPSLDSVDAFIQSPSPTRPVQSDCVSPRNSGLLDALLHESQTLSSAKNQSSEKSSNSCVVTPGDIVDSSALNVCEAEWEEYGDPISPLGRSAASVFSECTPASGSSLDETPAGRALCGSEVKQEPIEHVTTPDEGRQITPQLSFPRPDALLDGAWFEQRSECAKDQSVLADAISTFIGEDFYGDYKQIPAASSNQGWGGGSYFWNNLPAVCQMSELP
ncbi:hypothetical protein AQUCO_01400928v1 [Aquilegia coerulea]|uniref:Transcription factor n=2 Tax=Aquilegia coerulea TaxID=218851 RepID=A0A2G5DYU9_AQUCA|nr:hypothetical protein AQUCO_01400928v1 [Aquilegia coerulea]PIA48692.1 hypothetical protein AQUCO_01400928v1 [Aquilegia coerulea]PIA48693.1 hypothetical protein AQUCO_01400928v1 [Aquilegia coerulea]